MCRKGEVGLEVGEEARIVSDESLLGGTSAELRAEEEEVVGKKRMSDSEDPVDRSVLIDFMSAVWRLMMYRCARMVAWLAELQG